MSAYSTWAVAWSSKLDFDATGGDADLLVMASQDGGATWNGPTVLNSYATEDSTDDSSVRLLSTADGGFLALWRSLEDLDGISGAPDLVRAIWTPLTTPCDDGDPTTLDVCTESGCENVPF
jgi:hypothetical protein